MRAFFDYFVSIFGKSPRDQEISFKTGSLNRYTRDFNQVSDMLKQINVSKSTGHEKIGNLVLKMCHDTRSKSLTFIFQSCLTKTHYPDARKTSQAPPILEEDKKIDVSCYRPNSLLCFCSKAFEKVSFDAIYRKIKGGLVDSQYEFRKRWSTKIELLLFLRQTYELYDKSKTHQLAFLEFDYAETFDTVQHGTLVDKIKTFGIGGKLLSLIHFYVINR